MNGFAVLDLETTGLRPAGDRVIEVSLVLYDVQGREETAYTSLVNPEAPIPSVASSINGITDEMVAAAPRFRDLADHLAALMTGRVLVGHNIAGFDRNFLSAEFSRAGITWEPYGLLDTLRLARIAYPGLKTHKLGALCELAGIVNTHAHRAESDARAAWQLLCTIAADDVDDLTDLDRYELPTFTSAMPAQLVARRPVKRAPDRDLVQTCVGETVTFTGGKPDGFASREEARDAVLARGGAVSNSVTKKTTLVFVGDNAGSKLDRAREIGVTIAPHSSFAAFLTSGRPALDDIETPVIRRYDGREDVAGPKSSAPVAPVDHRTPPASIAADVEDPQEPSTQRTRVRAADTTPNTSTEVATHTAALSGERELSDVPARSKGMAIFLAVVFGAFGAHRFYLGDHRRGRLMAAASVVTLGALAPVMAVLGLIDAYRIRNGSLRRSR
jgi:DNA polymerase III epsilon subunit family exonuclease